MRAKSAKELEAQWTSASWFSRSSNPTPPSEAPNLRLRRALSWLSRAEEEFARDDFDAAFIFHWIAFNAAYGRLGPEPTEKKFFHEYLQRVISHDGDAVKKATWSLEFPIRRLINNKYVFQLFWDYYNQESSDSKWEKEFKDRKNQIERALHQRTLALQQKTARHIGNTIGSSCLLCELFDRLYTLRNQLLHGGATCRGSVNRHQVKTGAEIMTVLVPCFLEVMIQYPEADWGSPRYPPVV